MRCNLRYSALRQRIDLSSGRPKDKTLYRFLPLSERFAGEPSESIKQNIYFSQKSLQDEIVLHTVGTFYQRVILLKD